MDGIRGGAPGPGRIRLALGLLALAALLATLPAEAADLSRILRGIPPGTRLEVEGRRLPDGSFVADEIEIRYDDDVDEELRGNLRRIDRDARRAEALGFVVLLPQDVEILLADGRPGTLDDLTEGLRVKIDGLRDDAGRFVARKVRVREAQYEESKLVGPLEALEFASPTEGRLRLLGLTVIVTPGTDFSELEGLVPMRLRQRLGVVDDDDVLIAVQEGRRLQVGGELRARFERLHDIDLGLDDEPDTTTPGLFAIFGAALDLDALFAYVEVEGSREYSLAGLRGLAPDDTDPRVDVGEAYVQFFNVGAPWSSLAVGRQKFNEEREWFFNRKRLDGLRWIGTLHGLRLEASVTRNLLEQSDRIRDRDLTNVIVQASWTPNDDLLVEGFFIARDDRTEREESPRLLGARVMGEIGRLAEYWIDAALERGRRGEVSAGRVVAVRDVRAWGADAGITFGGRGRWRPTLTLGYAFGSGDDEDDPEVDRTFRQTGLQRNRDRWEGTVSFRYYGEVSDFELSNVAIATVGAGLRPTPSTSIDVIWHRYEQDVASRAQFESDLEERPTGDDPFLGHEWNVALGYEPSERLELRLTAGRFFPGDAYPDGARRASVLRFQAKLRF
ncbi:MAG: hypothetical protein D6738_03400 [Acidobacteria bacterium]|nr:MAG: hypothetical protein D6738_03400 [Acidobacteriota bacterium]